MPVPIPATQPSLASKSANATSNPNELREKKAKQIEGENNPEIIRRAKQAIQRKDKATAQRLLSQVVRQNPHSEIGWLWLSAAVEDVAKKQQCLDRVLQINPENKQALACRQQLQSVSASNSKSKTHPKPTSRSGESNARGKKLASSGGAKKKRSKGRYKYLLYAVIDLAVISLVVAGFILEDMGIQESGIQTVAVVLVVAYALVLASKLRFKFGGGIVGLIISLLLYGTIGPVFHLFYSLFKLFTYEEVAMTKYDFSNADFRGAIVNIESEVVQNIGTIPYADPSSKGELVQLTRKLSALLQQAPPEKSKDAEAVVETAKRLVDDVSKVSPNKAMIQVTAESLKKAAKNIADVLPSILPIVEQIVVVVMRIISKV